MDEIWTSILSRLDVLEKNDERNLANTLAIMGRLDVLESGIEQIASFLRSKKSTLGETFPKQQPRKAREENEGYVPGRHFKNGKWID